MGLAISFVLRVGNLIHKTIFYGPLSREVQSITQVSVLERLGTALASERLIDFQGGMQDGAGQPHLDRRRGDRNRFIDRRLITKRGYDSFDLQPGLFRDVMNKIASAMAQRATSLF